MRKNESGQALIAVIAGISLVLIALSTAIVVVQFSGKIVARQLVEQGQALNAAQAGLTEGLSWFRRQPAQPVTNFAPVLNTSVSPPILDTEDPTIGLVRNYPISDDGRVWGRYELRRTGYPAGTNTIDVTTRRGKTGSGIVWQLESIGTVYVRNKPSVAYNVQPNAILSQRTLRTEIERLGFTAPADAALVVTKGSAINLPNTAIDIRGNAGIGIAFQSGTGNPTGNGHNTNPGNPPNHQITGGRAAESNGIPGIPNRFAVPSVFGMTVQELRATADAESATVAALPYQTVSGLRTLPSMQLLLLNDPANQAKTYTFDQNNPLNGTGILVVFGNLVIAPNSDSNYNGMIFVVKGAYSQSAPSTVNGTVIVDCVNGNAGTVLVQGAGDKSNIRYDANLMSYMARRMGLYNTIRNPYQP